MTPASTPVRREAGSRATSEPADTPLPAISYERYPGAASALLPRTYRRREPEKSVLHTVVREHLETLLEQARFLHGEGYPRFIEREFRRYLDCGLLCHGFARLRCPACGHERIVAFSCKGRLCPSCVGRRMADTAAYLVDQLLPEAGYRQWVLTFPWALRFRLAVDRKLFSALISAFLRTLFAWQRRRGRALGIPNGQTGAVSFVQRFGGAFNLHPHVHSLVPDGLFVSGPADQLAFVALPAPTTEEIETLLLKIARRLSALIERLCADEFETQELLAQTVAALQHALTAAVKPPIAPALLNLPGQELQPPDKPLCARLAGFSLHGAQAVSATDRAGLERLCRYGLRAPFSQERLSLLPDGRVAYHLRRPWPHALGTRWLLLEPLDFLRRLAALIPAPYTNLVRYHGLFANRSRWRPLLPTPPSPPSTSEENAPPKHAPSSPTGLRRRSRLPWAQLLLRVFSLNVLACPQCATPMVVLALISDLPVIKKILRHLRLPVEPPPRAPARGWWDPHSEPPRPPGDPIAWENPEPTNAAGERSFSTPPASLSPSAGARPPP